MKNSKKTIQNDLASLKSASDTIGREFFYLYCEDNEILKESMDEIVKLARESKDDKLKLDVRKFLIDQLIGKSKQSSEIKGDISLPSLIIGDIKE